MRLLRQAARVDPERATTHNSLAWYLLTGPAPVRHDPEALRHARRAVELWGGRPEYLNTLGVALYRNGHHARAIRVLRQGLAAGKGRYDGWDLCFLAMGHARLGERAKAKACFERAAKWVQEHKGFTAVEAAEMKQFRAEAEQVLAGK